MYAMCSSYHYKDIPIERQIQGHTHIDAQAHIHTHYVQTLKQSINYVKASPQVRQRELVELRPALQSTYKFINTIILIYTGTDLIKKHSLCVWL